jgi:hypothetical protein
MLGNWPVNSRTKAKRNKLTKAKNDQMLFYLNMRPNLKAFYILA